MSFPVCCCTSLGQATSIDMIITSRWQLWKTTTDGCLVLPVLFIQVIIKYLLHNIGVPIVWDLICIKQYFAKVAATRQMPPACRMLCSGVFFYCEPSLNLWCTYTSGTFKLSPEIERESKWSNVHPCTYASLY